jgi:ABC-type Fe3+ transport system substrate-binding protein
LLKYKPANYSKVYAGFRDPDGYYTALGVLLIGTVVNSQQVPNESQYPRTAADFLRPEFGGGRLVVIHPKMDDFILFYFKQVLLTILLVFYNTLTFCSKIVDKYGMDYLARFAAQQPVMVCEGMPQFGAVGLFPSNLTASVGVAAFASFDFGNGSVPRLAFPEDDDPFATYATYGAIFADAKRPETAKLYINWQLEKESPVRLMIQNYRMPSQ